MRDRTDAPTIAFLISDSKAVRAILRKDQKPNDLLKLGSDQIGLFFAPREPRKNESDRFKELRDRDS